MKHSFWSLLREAYETTVIGREKDPTFFIQWLLLQRRRGWNSEIAPFPGAIAGSSFSARLQHPEAKEAVNLSSWHSSIFYAYISIFHLRWDVPPLESVFSLPASGHMSTCHPFWLSDMSASHPKSSISRKDCWRLHLETTQLCQSHARDWQVAALSGIYGNWTQVHFSLKECPGCWLEGEQHHQPLFRLSGKPSFPAPKCHFTEIIQWTGISSWN